jgi:glycosyltransferase involved in cell wall biosynthesis
LSAASALARPFAATLTRRWPQGSRLFLVGEGTGWSIDHDLQELAATAGRLGVRVAPSRLLSASRGQVAFYGSQFTLLREPWSPPPHRLVTAYFHGRPGTPGYPEFDECFRVLRDRHAELARVQVTHVEMHDLVLSSGIDAAKVIRIPIGVEPSYFALQTPESRSAARAELGLPQDAFVVGSFQKDGVGWGDGLEPKLIKGPDTLVDALRRLHRRVPELHVLLSGPARGFVKQGLDRDGIPYLHRAVARYADLARLYRALDAYLVPSRQEGGPKAVLESMASGVPLVTTKVGQATDLVRNGDNGWLVDVDDVEAMVERLAAVADGGPDLPRIREAGFATAGENAYEAQLPLWRAFFDGLVAMR